MSPEGALLTARALLKRTQEPVPQRLGQALSEEERSRLVAFDASFTPLSMRGEPTFERMRPTLSKSRRDLLRVLKAKIPDVLGGPLTRFESGVWQCESRFGATVVVTYFDMSNSLYGIECDQSVYHARFGQLASHRSVLSSLGISHTYWQNLAERSELIVGHIAELTRMFVDAVPEWLPPLSDQA
jgi:hypothetical protein